MQSRKPSRRQVLSVLSVVSLASAALTAIVFRYGDEAYWPVMLAASLPPVVFSIFPLILLIISGVKRNWRVAGVNVAALLLVAGPIMGFHWRVKTVPLQGRAMRVMTWNVEKWSHGPDAIARGVRAQHPDVVCFQEAGDYPYVQGTQGEGLIAALPDYHFVRAGEIIVASRWPMTKLAESPLPGPASRPALCVSVDMGGRKYTVVCVHLLPSDIDKHIFSTRSPLNVYSAQFAARRQSQGVALLHTMDALPGPKILCGDFNLQPQSESCRRLTRIYPDAFEAAGRGYGYTLTAETPVERADHILVSRDVTVRDCWVPSLIASDHRAVVADITLPKRSQ
ncbi:MAG: endonuclease/exonuclease/phosphatase family protein [Capsulimonas sp.]|uniref:endonuclease/exonuclease/phosphatase family protein n=1 Tax=Capsulimonas sp. TaxID=2494211 RepID=UPI00326689E3